MDLILVILFMIGFVIGILSLGNLIVGEIGAGIVGIIIGVIIIFTTCSIGDALYKHDETTLQQHIKNQEFSTIKTVVTGIQKDKLTTQAGDFIIEKNVSKITNVTDFKVDQTLKITFVQKGDIYFYPNRIIIFIEIE